MSMDSQVGVLLDEIPAGALRAAAAANALAQGSDYWSARAARQTKLAYYRLVFRGEYYPNYKNNQKGPLPLPDKSKWNILLTGPAQRITTADGHDVVARPYNFNTYIVADATSPAIVEANFKNIGGTWDEPIQFPIDPELLLERTDYACMDEAEYPQNSVFEENTFYFCDQTCAVEQPGHPTNYCHFWHFPSESCQQALTTRRSRMRSPSSRTRISSSARANTLDVNNNPVDPTDLSALVFDPTNPPVYDSTGGLVSKVRCAF